MSVNNSLGYNGFPLPVGTILPSVLSNPDDDIPSAWLYCGGQELAKAEYPELYQAIGNNFNLSTTASDKFCLPDLSTPDNYILPHDKTEAGGDGGVVPASIQTDTDITIPTNAIPSLTGANFTKNYATTQVGFARGVSFNVRGDYEESTYFANSTSSATPDIVKLNSSTENAATFTLVSADYKFKNDNQQTISNIKTDSTHGIQYGGIKVCYIIKVSSFLYDPQGDFRKSWDNNRLEALANAQAQADEAAAYAIQTNNRNQQADQIAQEQKLALDAGGQGGGTEVPYDDVPNLSGFVIPPNPPI